MKIIYTNARSLISKLDHLDVLIKTENPHLILITESWLNPSISNAMLSFDNYSIENALRLDRNDTAQGRGGGLIVFNRSDVVVNVIDCTSNFNQFCKFSVTLNDKDSCPLYVTLVYRSPNATSENTNELAKLIENCEPNSLIIGDFNLPKLDIENSSCDAKSQAVFDAASFRCMSNVVDFCTHVRGNTLDLALVTPMTKPNIYCVDNIGTLANSDHAVIRIELFMKSAFNKSTQKILDWNKGDIDGLKSHIQGTDFATKFQGIGMNEAWMAFRATIDESISRYIPLKDRRKSGNPQWMTRGVKNLINRKNRAWKNYAKKRTEENFAKYKQAEKDCKKGVQQAKRRFERSIADSGNKRPFSSYIKSKTKARDNVGPLKVNGEVIGGNKEMAGVLNEFFTSVFTVEPIGPVPEAKLLASDSGISDIRFSANLVRKKLLRLKPDSAPGPDKVTTRFLRDFADELAPVLAMLYNKSMEEGEVPEDWRTANVTPIFKKGSKGDPGNYRPVSLTSVPCRVMEAIIRDEVVKHLDSNQLINNTQHGFMQRKSCTTNLLVFLEKLTTEVDLGNNLDVVYLDFAKAFDKVPHRRLMEKMQAHHIRGNVHRWIERWLEGRSQRTVLNGEASSWRPVLSGVPQGSVLGPLAFVIFINDIDEASRNISIISKFADDTKCGQIINGDSDVQKLQECLNNLTDWADKWGMAFNVAKCKVLHIGRSNAGAKYTMNGAELSSTEEERDIGVRITANLKPSRQCNEAARRAAGVLGQISRSFHYRDKKTFLQLYKQYVRPHMEFAVPTWSPWTVADKEVLEKVQERAIRMISGLKGETYEERLAELGMPSLELRRVHYDLVQVYKIIRGKDNVDPSTWFELVGNEPARITRHTQDPDNIVRQTPRSDLRKYFFSNRVIERWNNLPSEIKKARNVQVFKDYVEKVVKQ